jgi:FO synthase subunit 2
MIDLKAFELSPNIIRILGRALDDQETSVEEGVQLFEVQGREFFALIAVADELRCRRVGDIVTYVVNRNINFTNICMKRCGFCAFSRAPGEEGSYLLSVEEVVRRAEEAWELGATEVCIQAGLAPKIDGNLYVEICRAIKEKIPQMHIHAFSPEEIVYGARQSHITVEDHLRHLQDAGLGSLPGTSAEILDDQVRKRISPQRICVAEWVNVITTAHRLGIPTSATIMYGHVEDSRHKAQHLALLRNIQKETGGFTEFVPLSFVHSQAPMYQRGLPGLRPGPSGADVLKMYAVSRLMLNGHIDNIQVSWVKEGPKLAQLCLNAGANDFGGTLMEESISTAAGATFGQQMHPEEFQRLIREIGRIPAQRSTTYEIVRAFEGEMEESLTSDVKLEGVARS